MKRLTRKRLRERFGASKAMRQSLAAIARKHKGGSSRNQRDRIVEGLKVHGALTTIEMRRELDVMSPAPRILELRRMGKPIKTEWVSQATESGRKHRVGLYVWGVGTP
jgi:hypothetical protein